MLTSNCGLLDIERVVLNMEQVTNDLLTHQKLAVYVRGSAQIVPSLDSSGILLNGLNQYLDAGKDVICKNDLHTCPRGFTLRFQLKPFQLADLTYFVSSAPIDVYYRYAVGGVLFSRLNKFKIRTFANSAHYFSFKTSIFSHLVSTMY